uniref:Homeobox protein Mohawk-like n=1 Tax=Petromyzon marinus TaxID=7757 RepID=A0AAJ7TEF7_PETMA|nr:homeobox protein Mohawk-like [Petromyzon marinus]
MNRFRGPPPYIAEWVLICPGERLPPVAAHGTECSQPTAAAAAMSLMPGSPEQVQVRGVPGERLVEPGVRGSAPRPPIEAAGFGEPPGTDAWDSEPGHGDMHPSSRRSGALRVRHKRQALQDMARPLKHWLYKHRHNPYPTKTEKILLALGSHMTLVQVSNWFANARRRLKNTVRQPELSWAMRIKLYNQYVQGNAERLSVCSGDSCCAEEGEALLLKEAADEDRGREAACGVRDCDGPGAVDSSLTVENVSRRGHDCSPPHQYKKSLLRRYLRDSCKHVLAGRAGPAGPPGAQGPVARGGSGHAASLGSACYEDGSISPVSSESDRRPSLLLPVHGISKLRGQVPSSVQGAKELTYWKELHAAMALTNLGTAHSQELAGARALWMKPSPAVTASTALQLREMKLGL